MRLLYILDFFYPHIGGVPTVFINLAEQMVKRGHDVTVVTSHANSTKKFEKFKGIKIYRFGRKREQFLINSTLNLLGLREKFDLVHTSTYSAMIPSYIFSSLKNVPKILSAHEIWTLKEWLEFMQGSGLFYFLEERILLSLPFDFYISPSEHTKKDLMKFGIDEKRIKVIPHGIDTKIFHPKIKNYKKQIRKEFGISENSVIGCFVGKPTIFKGIEYLISAIEKISEKSDAKFIFLLSKSHASAYEKFLKKVYSSKTLRKNIILAKTSTDQKFVAKIIAASDFLLMPSLTEGFGFAAAEAVSVGTPVIVTKDTSLTEVVDEGKNATYVNLRNSNKLAKAILRMITSKKFRSKLSNSKKFSSWEDVAKKYEKVYEEVILKYKEV